MRHITRLLNYHTMAIWLFLFSAIGLSEYWISDWRIQETIGLLDIGSRPQSIGLSDIGLRKNYRFRTSDTYMIEQNIQAIAAKFGR
jgi:hypothetical protein